MFQQELEKMLDMQENTQSYHSKLLKSEDDYISQFIALPNQQPQQQENPISCDIQEKTVQKEPKKRSQFHNFQKHLITTVKRIVKPNFEEGDKVSMAAKQIWSKFKSVKKYTKQFLSAITNPQISNKIVVKYELNEINKKYGEQIFVEAQVFLKKEIIRCFEMQSLDDILYDRRLEKKEEFTEYLQKTVQQLKQGTINKRIVPVFWQQS